jgi:hypothetical protein
MTADVWYDNPDTVWSVAAYALDEGQLSTGHDVLSFFEKPWNYGELHDAYAHWAHLSDKADR